MTQTEEFKPSLYCRKCSYVLNGLIESRCPECGLSFDPADDRTFLRKPKRKAWLTTLMWVLGLLVGLPVAVVASVATRFRVSLPARTVATRLAFRNAAL